MVVILQQTTTDNGKRFVSTLVEDQQGTVTMSRLAGNFNSTLTNSVSEQSAIYKQRIDSLFGCHKGPPSTAIVTSGTPLRKTFNLPKFLPLTSMSSILKADVTSEDEGYQRIDEDELNSSLLPDSLNFDTRNTFVDSNPWRNRTYCNMTSSHFATDLQPQLDHEVKLPTSSNGILQFPAQYLGSVGLQGATATLQDLQSPLRSLYLNFLKNRNISSGQLSIASEGLQFDCKTLRLISPFSTISVWAAIKFVVRGDPPIECAFMPLISDPEGQDKRRLFGKMDSDLGHAYLTSLRSANLTGFRNPPIFACVTRQGVPQRSECVGFTCKSAEDAIVIAANLYQHLLVNELKTHKEGESGYGSLTNTSPMTTNQNSPNSSSREEVSRPFSSASSLLTPAKEPWTPTNASGSTSFASQIPDKINIDAAPPLRPPRRHRNDAASSRGCSKEYNSDDSCSVVLKMPIQRRKSFKTYSHRYQRSNPAKLKKRVKISTPPDHGPSTDTIERILDNLVHPRSRSLNDLKPSYKKLILKLALILTHDHRSKNKESPRKRQGRNTNKPAVSKLRNQREAEQVGNLGKPLGKTALGKGGASLLRTNPGTVSANPMVKGEIAGQSSRSTKSRHDLSICSGCVCNNCSDKCYCSLPTNTCKSAGSSSASQGTLSASSTPCRRDGGSIQSSKKLGLLKPRDTGCGYMCYETESCAESEKCYCSLQGVKYNGLKVYNINLDTETSDTDTNSYDLQSFNHSSTIPNIHCNDIAGQRGQGSTPIKILAYNPGRRHSSDSQVSREMSGLVHRQNSNGNGPPSSKTKNETTLEDEMHPKGRSSPSRRQRKKVLLLSDCSTSSREDLLMGHDDCSAQRQYNRPSRVLGHIPEDDDCSLTFPTDNSIHSVQVLDMKKTAEIEAMFTTLNIGQNRTVVDGNPRIGRDQEVVPIRRKSCAALKTVRYSSVTSDFQTSLGYLP